MKSFLLIGQSNMAGRGDFGEVPEIKNANCYMLRMGRWQPMCEPINPDRAVWGYYHSGIGLSASFAEAITEITNTTAKELGCGFVSASGLPCKNDGIHFTSASYRELGKRYFKAYKDLVK